MNNRLVLILLFALFLAPVLAAVLLQSSWLDWQPEPERAHGTLIEPVVALEDFELSDAGGSLRTIRDLENRWWLVRIVDGSCDDNCLERLDLLHRVRLTQDRHVGDIGLLLLTPSTLVAELRTAIHAMDPAWTVFDGPAGASLRARFPDAQDGSTFIVDPEANIMERFEPDADPNGIRKDLRKLLTWTLRE